MPKGNLVAPGRVGDLLRVADERVDLSAIDPRATPGFEGGKADARALLPERGQVLADLQEKLYAHGRTGGSHSVLLVLQGMDTSGKGGTVDHVLGQVDPGGVHIASFGKPTKEELAHDFLWRIRAQLPRAGKVGVFDRSHYEDVVTVRVQELVDRATWRRRFATINRFEQRLAEGGMVIVKCFLHISREEQRDRLLARLDDPTKHWKYNPADLTSRASWDDYMTAYGDAIARCNRDEAPWYVVPADRKWYRNWAITNLLIERLEALGLDWPKADFDVAAERKKLLAMS
jgi:PPK2 family polyphosphate:nucleotide phosphotransferase